MYSEMDMWTPLTTQPFLLECDTDLVKEALSIILAPYAENSVSPESTHLAHALNNYIKECNNAFLASERIRLFLLFCLLAVFVISFITLAAIPLSIAGMILIGVTASLIAAVNFFTLYHQTGYRQEIESDKLKQYCSEYTEKLASTKFKPKLQANKTLEQILCPISHFCLFTPKKTPPADMLQLQEGSLDPSQNKPLPAINEDPFEASNESNPSRLSHTK